MKKLIISLIFVTGWSIAFGQTLRIAVAANAEFVAHRLKADFKKSSGIGSEIIVGSSGKLTTQIEQGAPFDIFLSADTKYPQALEREGLIIGKSRIYGYGQLVLWTLKTPSIITPAQLIGANYAKIAIANPTLAPYGEAATEALTKLNLFDKVKGKIVYGESIAQVNQYLLTGVADAAFTAKSIVLSPDQKGKGSWIALDDNLYAPIAQAAVILKGATKQNLPLARKFFNYLFSPRAKKILKTYGYK